MYVICCGMYRSASTWQYLVASELIERAGMGRGVGFVDGNTFQEMTQGLDDSSQTFVLKCHDFHVMYGALIAERRAVGLYTYRDIRDVACSFAWKLAFSFDQTIDSAAFRSAIDSYYRWVATPGILIQRYDALIHAPAEAVQEIASHLQLPVDDAVIREIAAKFDVESNRRRTDGLRESLLNQGLDLTVSANAILFDDSTLLHWNHIRPSGTPDWRLSLSPDELRRLQPIVQQWLIDTGYEKDDSWVSRAIARQKCLAAVRVGIVIVVTKGGERLTACLRSLQQQIHGLPDCTIIVVAGSGQVPALAPSDGGGWLHIVETDSTPHLTAAANLAAARTEAEYLVFLDEHARVEPDWLRWLVHTADRHPDAGAIASVLVSPDERCQQAGSVVRWDASIEPVATAALGSHWPSPCVREVDCASTAAVLLRREAWRRLEPATPFSTTRYRDADLCFRVRRLGFSVLVEPRSCAVVDLAGTVEDDAAARERDRREFAQRWRAELDYHEPVTSGDVVRAVHRARGYPRRVLIVDDVTPTKDAGAGFGRMFDGIVELAANGWSVSHCATREASAPSEALIDCGVSLVNGVLAEHLADPGTWYDAIVVSRPFNFSSVSAAVRTHQPWSCLIYDSEALWWRRIAREAEIAVDGETASRLRSESEAMRELEVHNARTADFTITVSDEEAQLLRNDGVREERVWSLPPFEAGVRATTRPWQKRQDIGFVSSWLAGSGSPNSNGLVWFVRNVLPAIRQDVPEVRLRVTGDNPPPEVLALADTSVHLEGFVPDLDAFYDQIRVAIVPNRVGAGVKLKTVQAVQYGVPVVATSVGAEGLALTSSDGVRISEDAEGLAAAVIALLTSEDEWDRSRRALTTEVEAWRRRRRSGASWPQLLDQLCRTHRECRGEETDMTLRHLHRDIADREAFIAQFRTEMSKQRAELEALHTTAGQFRREAADASERVAGMLAEHQRQQQQIDSLAGELQRERASHDHARATIATQHAHLTSTAAELADVRRDLAALRVYASSAGFQFVNRAIVRLKTHPRLYRTLQSMVRKLPR